jgi:hypothetical protein
VNLNRRQKWIRMAQAFNRSAELLAQSLGETHEQHITGDATLSIDGPQRIAIAAGYAIFVFGV